MNKFLIGAAVLGFSFNAAAQSDIINADVQKSLAATQESMQKSVDRLDRQMQQVVADSFAQMMQDFFKTLPPLMKSIEENQVLSKAANQINQELDSQISEVGKELSTYQNYKAEQTAGNEDKFMVSGSKNDDGKKLDFAFSQNDNRLQNLRAALEAKTAPDGAQDFSLTDLSNQKLRGRDFKLEFIDKIPYLVYDDGDTYCYITGIAEDNMIVRVQTSGFEAPERARNFIKNSRRRLIAP